MVHSSPNQETDEEIAKKALTNKEAFGALMSRYQAPLERYIRRLGVPRKEDAEDILQNTFLKAYRNLNGFNTTLKFSSWIYRITHNETVSFIRTKHTRPEAFTNPEDDLLERIPAAIAIERGADQVLDRARIAHALAALDQKYRDVIVLRFFEERDYAEISDVLQIPKGTVATLLNRAKKRLKHLL